MLGLGDEPLEPVEIAECGDDLARVEGVDVRRLQPLDECAHDHEFIMTGGCNRVVGTGNELRLGSVELRLHMHTGCGAAWLARLSGGQEVGSSNLPSPTKLALVRGHRPPTRASSVFGSVAVRSPVPLESVATLKRARSGRDGIVWSLVDGCHRCDAAVTVPADRRHAVAFTARTGSPARLAQAMFHWIEAFCNPTRRHSTLGYLSPVNQTTTTA